jgi:hypothetical protein
MQAAKKRPEELFWIATPEQILHKLYWEISQFKQACIDDEYVGGRNAVFNAFNCAITAVRCADRAWAFAGRDTRRALGEKFEFPVRGNRSDMTAFGDALEKHNRDFYICRRLANGSGYLRPRDQKEAIEAVVEQLPVPDEKFHVNFVIYDGDRTTPVAEVFERMLLFWERFYREYGLMSRSGGPLEPAPPEEGS